MSAEIKTPRTVAAITPLLQLVRDANTGDKLKQAMMTLTATLSKHAGQLEKELSVAEEALRKVHQLNRPHGMMFLEFVGDELTKLAEMRGGKQAENGETK